MASKQRNGLQAVNLTCEMEEGLRKHLVKPREVAKMPTEPRYHASKEERLVHLEFTHTKPLTPFLTSLKPSQPIAPTEKTIPSKETTRTEVKVLIQPTQEATTDAPAP